MTYLIFGEKFSGVIASQALDTCTFLEKNLGVVITPIIFLPVQGFKAHRKRYREYAPRAIIVPMLVGSRWYSLYSFLLDMLSFFIDLEACLARGVTASFIGLKSRRVKRLIYDGRGAHGAEYQEYFKEQYGLEEKQIDRAWKMEKKIVLQADFRIAVSQALINYWKEEFNYQGNQHIIIPCTLNQVFEENYPDRQKLMAQKKALGFSSEDIVIVFSGSASGWQSLHMIDDFLYRLMKEQDRIKVLFLSKLDLTTSKIGNEFPGRIVQAWLPINEVYPTMAIADYGILFREETVTNKVAAPVKFAEYLAAGLQVLISKNIGDYSEIIQRQEHLGYLVDFTSQKTPVLKRATFTSKRGLNAFALENFTKVVFKKSYHALFKNEI